MATASCSRSLVSSVKRLKLSPTTPTPPQFRQIQQYATSTSTSLPSSLERELASLRLPKAVQATYLAPLRHAPNRANPEETCNLQLRSYSVRNLDLFTDFALRAAYYLKLPASGVKPLPRITERWTVPRSNFVHKKSQENFERITMRRGISILDGNPDVVAIWLAFLRKHQYYGVGMKANVWESGSLAEAAEMDRDKTEVEKMLEAVTLHGPKTMMTPEVAEKLLLEEPFKGASGGYAALGGGHGVPHATRKVERIEVVSKEADAKRKMKIKPKESGSQVEE